MDRSDDFDYLVYLRIHEGCNLYCDHCFIPANPKSMTLEQISRVPSIVSQFAEKGSHIRLQWHGGEPTIVGAEWIENAINIIESDASTSFVWTHDIQTNLMLYSDEWADLYKRHFGGKIGVSWDPFIRSTRKDKRIGVEKYNERFFINLKKLISDGIEPYMTITSTKPFFKKYGDGFSLFYFLENIGVRRAHIERLTRIGRARDVWEEIGISNKEYSYYMSRILRAYVLYLKNGGTLRLSPFDDLFLSFSGYKSKGCISGICDNRFHTIDANGYKSGCTALTSEIDNKNSGGRVFFIKDISLERTKRVSRCIGCEYNGICSSSCLSIDFDDGSGECSGAFSLLKLVDSLKSEVDYESNSNWRPCR